MRRTLAAVAAVTGLALTTLVVSAAPAAAASSGPGARPWHYWISFFLVGGAVLLLVAIGIGYWIRVFGGPRGR